MSSESLLFEKAPLEGQGQKKKRAKKQSAAVTRREAEPEPQREVSVGVLASLDEVCCPQCGAPADLVEVLIVDGSKRWRVMCGWWCMVAWVIDAIPGLLEEPKKAERPFVVREGRFAGKTFDEIDAAGERWYIDDVAELSNDKRAKAAAIAWLAKKIA